VGHRHIGYACCNNRLGADGLSAARTFRIANFSTRRAAETAGLNLAALKEIVLWNADHAVQIFRVGSNIFPFADHTQLGYRPTDLQPLVDVEGMCREIGKIARDCGQELTVHPGQFVCMASPREEVVEASVRCLEMHAQMGELLGLGGWKTVFHVGGTYGDKEATLARLGANLGRLSPSALAGLVIENDDKRSGYSVRDLVRWGRLPVVLDTHHHQIHPDGLDIRAAAAAAFSTWGGRTPKIHVSEPCPVRGGLCRDHAQMPSAPPPQLDGTYDIMMEYKGKEDALFRMKELVEGSGGR
jgi:UV DNA damage endonuclease